MKKKLTELLNDPDFEKLELDIKKPNIFSILNISKTEIRHSNFLAWILDPNENHGLNKTILVKVLRDIFSDDKVVNYTQFDIELLNFNNVEIRREWKNIDILILLDNIVIAIENKILSTDHTNQLERYQKITNDFFPRKDKVFVYLTPFGTEPSSESARSIYINYSYLRITDILTKIIEIYGESLNQKVYQYISDYNEILRRELMESDTLNELAIKLYKTHKEALDFIFENKPDPASELYHFFEEKVHDSSWVIGSKNKGFIRFLTPKLDEIIPKGFSTGLPNKESFLFEIDYFWSDKEAIFKTVIAPSNQKISKILAEALEGIPGHKKPKGNQWLVHFIEKWPFKASEINNGDGESIRNEIGKFWPKIEEIVARVEQAILQKENELRDIR